MTCDDVILTIDNTISRVIIFLKQPIKYY